MKDLKAMMGKSEESSGMKKDAKLSVLKQLRQMAADMVGDDVKGGLDSMKKVTVAAPDSSGLAEGLAKAKEMLAGHSEMESDEDMDEMPEDEMSEEEDMSPEEMKAKIAELQAKLASR